MKKRHYKILDKGHVKLIRFLGGDKAVIDAARRCWRSKSRGTDSDAKLINHLIKKDHGTPFEHAVFTFDIKCPLFVARQWFRHRIASYNEVSLRYCVAEKDCYIPANLKGAPLKKYKESINGSLSTYEELIKTKVSKEQARAVLPLALYTEFYWTINARSLMNFFRLRLDKGAQHEIREYALALFDIFETKMPVCSEAFNRFFKSVRSS
jgi:thymidylate synthase (FAD)